MALGKVSAALDLRLSFWLYLSRNLSDDLARSSDGPPHLKESAAVKPMSWSVSIIRIAIAIFLPSVSDTSAIILEWRLPMAAIYAARGAAQDHVVAGGAPEGVLQQFHTQAVPGKAAFFSISFTTRAAFGILSMGRAHGCKQEGLWRGVGHRLRFRQVGFFDQEVVLIM